ncbi:Ribosomal silencing factor RsfS [Sporotomaculum syntrophicum]|uniref:Ribosomal silencing factor RsfS n=1 Tax=Sporotomaculum syntrophicum TaxID=182264 RepID=A0A9D3AVR4_9FIRM|nr:ribosome silencing factor [Sporotomaculum syntrophicum]KAF1084460.1 Ribosomal silencing factor RsfS [Sporotomaculum syntrophicum]
MIIEPEVLVQLAVEAAEGKKAFDITVLNISEVSVVADYFIICSSRSTVHARAIADAIEEKLQEYGSSQPRREGFKTAQWLLLDYGSVVVHIFQEEQRHFYNLEHLWGDAQVVKYTASM